MAWLADDGWKVISVSEFVRASTLGKPIPERSVVITFDDGTACAHERALPVLAQHRFPATVYVVSGLLGARNEWMARDGHPEHRMLTTRQLRELDDAGWTIGSHTVDHVRLAGLESRRLQAEVTRSKLQLEDVLGKAVTHFAYPYGSHDEAAKAAVQAAGYQSACATLPGFNFTGADLFALHRTEVKGTDSLLQFRLKLKIGTHDMPPWSVARAGVRGLLARAGLRRARPGSMTS
jgi:peptidoglycan/xylan/chitin deacetylase (PgdA/CDA1 family)